MRMKRIGIWICSILCMISFVGCGQEEVVWKPINEDNTIILKEVGRYEKLSIPDNDFLEYVLTDLCTPK